MRVDFQSTTDGPFSFIHYTHFSIGNITEGYLLMVGRFTGTGTDQFALQNMGRFATEDNDLASKPCANLFDDRWWYEESCSGFKS